MTRNSSQNPKLRFPEFKENWVEMRIEDLTDRISIPVDVDVHQLYTQIGVRSHGKGLFHKQPVTGKELGNKRVFWVTEGLFVLNIVFAWEQAVAKTTKNELGTIASHRFPTFKPKSELLDLDFLVFSFLTKRGKSLLEIASPGGAGRNKTLGQEEFNRTKISIPDVPEQKKIATLLSVVDEKLGQLAKKRELLLTYKRAVIQQIFDQKIRFKDESDREFPQWKDIVLRDHLIESRLPGSKGDLAKKLTVKLWGRGVHEKDDKRVGSSSTQYYKRRAGQLIYSKLDFLNCAFGIIPEALDGYESTSDLPCFDLSTVINPQFLLLTVTREQFYLRNGMTADGSRKARRVHADTFLKFSIKLPAIAEQDKIVNFVRSLEQKIEVVDQQLSKTKTFKKGLLQQMFI